MANKHGSLSIDSENLFPIIKKWLYSDHDIFYRELISNGCDAITKLEKLEMMGEYQFPADYKKKIESVKRFERQLTDNGYLVMKFFFQISQKEQKKRIDALKEDKNTDWRVSGKDDWQNRHYEKCLKVSLNDSKIELEVFYAVCENITGYERIDINDQRCRKKCNGSNMANDSNNISNTNYLQNNISSSKP